MNIIDLQKKISNLHWDKDKLLQEKAISELSCAEEQYLPLIFPYTQKSEWENYVQIVDQIGYPRNTSMLPSLFFFMQDLNWPGSKHAMQILKAIDRRVLLPILEQTIENAYKEDDFEWLGGLKLFVDECHLTAKDFSSVHVFHLLEHASF